MFGETTYLWAKTHAFRILSARVYDLDGVLNGVVYTIRQSMFHLSPGRPFVYLTLVAWQILFILILIL
jgi:hypothetical protein